MRIKIADFELVALNELNELFTAEMKEKFHTKLKEGYKGWDDPKGITNENLKAKLLKNFEQGDYVDVACIAAILWNRNQ